jgi:hypothetical protein
MCQLDKLLTTHSVKHVLLINRYTSYDNYRTTFITVPFNSSSLSITYILSAH